ARPPEKQFTLRKASSCTRRCSFRVAPIYENSSLLPPVGVWAVLNPSVADHPLRPATDRGLGELLPHQLANRPQAHPKAPLRALLSKKRMRYCRRFLAGIPHLGAGTHVLLTRPPLPLLREGVRLACVRHAASVYPEPGSNSPFKFLKQAFTSLFIFSILSDPSQAIITWLFADSQLHPVGTR